MFYFNDSLVLPFLQQVNGLEADDAGNSVGPHPDLGAGQDPVVYPADGLHPQPAGFVVPHDHQADLVHMGRQQDPEALRGRPLPDDVEVPQRVHPHSVGVSLQGPAQNLPDLLLIARRAKGFREFLQEFHSSLTSGFFVQSSGRR